MAEIPDQRPIWNQKHANDDHAVLEGVPSPLAELCLDKIEPGSDILELGCGIGRDAIFFARHGNKVVATDGSDVVIDHNLTKKVSSSLRFELLDMRDTLPYKDNQFDVVYSNLSLHYYSNEKTREIIQNIGRVLKNGGLFIFACKSYDSLHNSGEELESNVVASPTGAILHFFTTDYVHTLLDECMNIEYLDEIEEEFNGRQSRIIRCIARKLK